MSFMPSPIESVKEFAFVIFMKLRMDLELKELEVRDRMIVLECEDYQNRFL